VNLTSDSHSTTDAHSPSPEEQLQRLLRELQNASAPLAKIARRQLAGEAIDEQAVQAARAEMIGRLDAALRSAALTGGQEQTDAPVLLSPADLAADYWRSLDRRKDCAGTGFAGLNRVLSGGLEPDRLLILLGAPGAGKTVISNQIADFVAGQRRPVLYVSSEDTPVTLLAKTIARRYDIEYTAVQRGWPSERARIEAAMHDYAQTEHARYLRYLDVTASGVTLQEIANAAAQHFAAMADASSGAPLLVVDYLQRLARAENLGADARQSATIYTERLRQLACELHCTVLCLSAMNRSSGYHAGNSTIAAAKESGDIDYTADVIIAIGADESMLAEPAPGMRYWRLRVDKNRQGTVTYDGAHIPLLWHACRQRFAEPAPDDLAELPAARGLPQGNGRRNGNGRRR
jgi:replicative DNA helicase